MAQKSKVSQVKETQFTIEALAKSKEYAGYSDLVRALFISRDKATKSEVDSAIENYLQRGIK